MTSLSERLSVVRQSQWEAQLDAVQSLTSRALDSAEQLFALNLKTSRAAIEHASGTFHQLLHAADPRELFTIGSQAQGQWQSIFSYSRELMGIAMGARLRSPLPGPATPAAPLQLITSPTPIAEAAEASFEAVERPLAKLANEAAETVEYTTHAPVPEPAPAPAAVDAPSELDAEKTAEAPSEVPATPPAPADGAPPVAASPAAVEIAPEIAPDAAPAPAPVADDTPGKTKVLVEAMNDAMHTPPVSEHPMAASMPAAGAVDLPLVTPADSSAPVRASRGPDSKPARASRKK